MNSARSTPASPTFHEALRFWLKLGFISFGGPAGQIAVMHRELVDEKRWISEARFLHALNYCMVLPGPEAQQLATYIGWLLHGMRGGLAAGVLFVLPSLFILVALTWGYLVLGDLPPVAGALWGIKAAVVAIVLQALVRIASRTLADPRERPLPWIVAVAAFLAIAVLHIAFPWVVAAALVVGALDAKLGGRQFGGAAAHGTAGSAKAGEVAGMRHVIDDHTATPAHAHFTRGRLAATVAIGLALWLVPMAIVVAAHGANGTLSQMAWFFTKAALLTFGGAYAVLPYVWQGAVTQFGWLTGEQMMAGLALGETTPGPLIMIVAFVGFVGGWTHEVFAASGTSGEGARFAGAALAAGVATWFTFLPSFVFILAGGPLVERTRGRLGFTAPLAAVSAAVVGVIASLALFFALTVARGEALWRPPGFAGGIDWPALALAGAAAVLLIRARVGVIRVIGACAAIGLAVRLLAA